MTGVVGDPKNGRDVRIMVHDGLVSPDFDDEGGIKVKDRYPVFYLKPNVQVEQPAWANEYMTDATAYQRFRRIIYEDQSIIDLWRPAWFGAIIIFLGGTTGLTGLYMFAQRRLCRGPAPPRHTRALTQTVSTRTPQTYRLRTYSLSTSNESTGPSAKLFRLRAALIHLDSATRGRERRHALTRRSRHRQESNHAPTHR